VSGDVAQVDVDGRVVAVSLVVLDGPVRAGDWLLVHSGLAIAPLADDDVQLLQQMRGERP
jgi:hydrogenase maturation factor